MPFKIQLTKNKVKGGERGECAVIGELQLGREKECFDSSLSYWQPKDYELHWKKALKRIIDGRKKSALIVYMLNPKKASYIFWWPIWRHGNKVYVRNQVLLLQKLKKKFDENNPFSSVGARETKAEDGESISEWQISIDEITKFYKSQWGKGRV